MKRINNQHPAKKRTGNIWLLLPVSASLLFTSLPSQAFYFLQAFNHSVRDMDGIRAGYHGEDVDLFWRSYLSYTPRLHRQLDGDKYGNTDLSLDYVLPIPGTYSTAFFGATINQSGERSVQAGLTLVKYVDLGWQQREGNNSAYLGVNLTF